LKNNYRAETDYLPINKWPQGERPREKLIKQGSEHLTNSELLAIILRIGISNNSNSKLKRRSCENYNSFKFRSCWDFFYSLVR